MRAEARLPRKCPNTAADGKWRLTFCLSLAHAPADLCLLLSF